MKNKKLIPVVILGFVVMVFFGGCVHTLMEHYSHPGAADITLQKMMVNCREDGLMRKKMGERTFSGFFNANTVKPRVFTSLDIFPPGRVPPKDRLFSQLKEKGFDSYLIVTLRDERIRWNHAFELIFHPVYMSDDPIVVLSYDLKLFDVRTRKPVWESVAEVRADTAATFPLVMKSLAKKAFRGMAVDGLITPVKRRY